MTGTDTHHHHHTPTKKTIKKTHTASAGPTITPPPHHQSPHTHAHSIGWPHLEESVAAFHDHSPGLTALVPDITGVDPDDAFSSVPYEKGFSLLVLLEQIVRASRVLGGWFRIRIHIPTSHQPNPNNPNHTKTVTPTQPKPPTLPLFNTAQLGTHALTQFNQKKTGNRKSH